MKQKLVESFKATPDLIKKLPLHESNRTILVENQEVRCIAAYTFPISRPGQKNLNGRIYGIDLWERVIREKIAEGAYGLCDHPEDEGSVTKAFCVWRNIRFNDDRSLVIADCYLFGKWGQHAKDAIDAGGAIGLSSVGYGDFLPDGITIDPNSYTLSRPSDWVLDPSYSVFGFAKDEIPPSTVLPTPSPTVPAEQGTELYSADDTEIGVADPYNFEHVIPSDRRSEGNLMERKMKLSENSFKLQMTGILKGLKDVKDPAARVQECREALQYFSEETRQALPLKELEEKFVAVMEEANAQVEELATKGAQLEDVQKALEDAQAKVAGLEEENAELKSALEAESNDLKIAGEMSESMQALVKERDAEIENLKNEMKMMFTAEELEEQKTKESTSQPEKKVGKTTVENFHEKKKAEKSDDADEDEGEEDEDGDDKDQGKDKEDDKEEKKKKREARKKALEQRKAKFEGTQDEPKAPQKPKKAESQSPALKGGRVAPEVQAYYESRRMAFPKTVKYKNEILSARTRMEAQKVFLKYKNEITETNYRPSFDEGDFGLDGAVLKEGASKNSPLKLKEGWW